MLGKLLLVPGLKNLAHVSVRLRACDHAVRWSSSLNSTGITPGRNGSTGKTGGLLHSIQKSRTFVDLRNIMRYADKHMQLVHVHAAMQRMQDVLDGAMNSGVQHDARRNAARCYRVVESLVESRFHEDADTVQRCAALASHPALQRQVSPALFQALSQCASQHATPDESIQQARRLADTLHLLCANNAPQDKEAASLLAADVAAHAPFFTPADASRTMYALAKLGVSQPSVYQAVAAQLAAAPSDLSQMSCKELALLAWAYAKAGVLHAPLMEAIAQAVQGHASQLSEQDISMLVWAAARLQKGSSPILTALAMTDALRVDSLGPEGLSVLAWACVLVRRYTSGPLAAALVAAAPAVLDKMDASQLITLMYANAVFKCGSTELYNLGVERLTAPSSRIASQLPALSASHLVRLLWTLGAHESKHEALVRQLVGQLQTAGEAGQLSPLDVSMVLTACARLQVGDKEAISQLLRCVHGTLVRGRYGVRRKEQAQAAKQQQPQKQGSSSSTGSGPNDAGSTGGARSGSNGMVIWDMGFGAGSTTAEMRQYSASAMPAAASGEEPTWLPAQAAAMLLCALSELKYKDKMVLDELTATILSPLPHAADPALADHPTLDPRGLCSVAYTIAQTGVHDEGKWRLILAGVRQSFGQDTWRPAHVATMLWSMSTLLPHHQVGLKQPLQTALYLLLAHVQRTAADFSLAQAIDVLEAAACLGCSTHPAVLQLQTGAAQHIAAGNYTLPQALRLVQNMAAVGTANRLALEELVQAFVAHMPELRLQQCQVIAHAFMQLGWAQPQLFEQLAQRCNQLLDGLQQGSEASCKEEVAPDMAAGLLAAFEAAPCSPARDLLLPRLVTLAAGKPDGPCRSTPTLRTDSPASRMSDWWEWQWP